MYSYYQDSMYNVPQQAYDQWYDGRQQFPGQQFPGGFGQLNQRLNRIERTLERQQRQIDRLDNRVDRIERRLGLG